MKLPQLKLPFFKKPKPALPLSREQTYWVISGLVILAILAIAISLKCQTPAPTQPADLNAPDLTATADTATTTATTTPNAAAKKAPAKAPAKPALTYEEAIKKYAGWRLQFDAACQISPSSFTLKNKTAIMLDNRSAVKQTISIGAKKYAVNPSSFLIVSVTASPLPQTLSISCNTRYNVGKILVQP